MLEERHSTLGIIVRQTAHRILSIHWGLHEEMNIDMYRKEDLTVQAGGFIAGMVDAYGVSSQTSDLHGFSLGYDLENIALMAGPSTFLAVKESLEWYKLLHFESIAPQDPYLRKIWKIKGKTDAVHNFVVKEIKYGTKAALGYIVGNFVGRTIASIF